jgi:hypothetical protein
MDIISILQEISKRTKEKCGNGDVALFYKEGSGWMIEAGNNTPVLLGEYGGEVSSWWYADIQECVDEINKEIEEYER